MRIFIAGETYYPGNNGQAIFTIHLAEGLARAGHSVHMLITNDHLGYSCEVINGVNVHKVRAINFDWVHPQANLGFFTYWQVQRLFREHKPDVAHLQDHFFLARDVILNARRFKTPVVGTSHFLPENLLPYLNVVPLPRRAKIRILWNLMLWTYNTLDAVTTPTETGAKILRKAGLRVPVSPLSCGVDTERFMPAGGSLDRAASCAEFGLDPAKTLFLYVGRLDREKRVDLLLRGLSKLARNGRDDIQLAVAGQGAAVGELRALARSLGLEQEVRFLGYVANEKLPLLYHTAHIFAMPSPEELQSIATLEAMASGRPVLAADARALPELITSGENGFLFSAGQVEEAARGMAYLVDRRGDWERMGRASRSKAMKHSLANTIRGYEEVYRRAIQKRFTAKGQRRET